MICKKHCLITKRHIIYALIPERATPAFVS
jgi:hypothetical protein